MKLKLLLFSLCLFALVLQFHEAYSKDKIKTRPFEIVGKTTVASAQGYKMVEYDPQSTEHLYVSEFDKENRIISKKQFLFKGNKFDLSISFHVYSITNKIIIDGIHTFYKEDGSVIKSLHYQNGEMICQYYYYPDGQKKLMQYGGLKLNGEYKMWHPNGQMSFSGNYNNERKNGDFEQFDESGKSIKKGIYNDGKLISGEAVVQDIIYNSPDVPAKYGNGDEDLNQYLKLKATQIDAIKNLPWGRIIELILHVDKAGAITELNTPENIDLLDLEIVKSLLNPLPVFNPALVENIPVDSKLTLNLLLSPEVVKLQLKNPSKEPVVIEQMPEFPGGQSEMLNFIRKNLKYPEFALKNKIQGKVFVNFVVGIDGTVSNLTVIKSVHPILDAEAVKVIRLMPPWTPGQQDGKPVRVLYAIPINFVLQ